MAVALGHFVFKTPIVVLVAFFVPAVADNFLRCFTACECFSRFILTLINCDGAKW